MSIIIIINCVAGSLFRVHMYLRWSIFRESWLNAHVSGETMHADIYGASFEYFDTRVMMASTNDPLNQDSLRRKVSLPGHLERQLYIMHIQVFIKVNRSRRCAWGRRTERAYLEAVFLICSAHIICSRTAQSLRISRFKRDRRIAIGT